MHKLTLYLCVVLTLLCLSPSFAQFTITSGSEVHVGDGVTMISHSDVNNQGTLNIGASVFTLDASLANTGTLDLTTATLQLGTSTSSNEANTLDISSNSTPIPVNQLILDANTSSFTGVSSSSGILRVTESLESKSGTLDAKGKIVLANTTATDAAQVVESSGGAVKDIVVERYIPSKRAFRLLASPVNSSGTIHANLQEGQNNQGTNYSDNLNNTDNYGTHITGSTTGDNGFDASVSGSPSMFLFNQTDQSWEAVPNTDNDKLQVGTAYRLMVRGSRAVNLTTNTAVPSATTLRTRGELHIGEHQPAIATGAGEFSFIANPYQAVVDYSSVTKAGLKDYIYMWDAGFDDSDANPRGKYATIDLTDLSNNPQAGLLYTKYILPGQSFFVQNVDDLSSVTPSLTFEEADKTVEQSIANTPFSTSTDITSHIKLYKADVYQDGGNSSDAALLRFNSNYTTQADSEDATKMWNPDENIAVLNQGYRVIDKRNFPEAKEIIPLALYNYKTDDYRLEIELSAALPASTMYLRDAYLETLIEIDSKLVYGFSIDQTTDSKNQDRFSLVFNNQTLGNQDFEELSLSAYPNPTEGRVSIEANSTVEQIEVFDITGKLVFKASQTSTVDIHHLNVGVYLFQIQTSEGTSTKKIIKY